MFEFDFCLNYNLRKSGKWIDFFSSLANRTDDQSEWWATVNFEYAYGRQ